MAMMLLTAWHEPAASAPDGQETRPAIACVDARATYVLTDRQRIARHTARWRNKVERLGRCFTIRPGAHWERISSLGGLALMRRTPPEPGLPPLYFRTALAPGPMPRHDDQVPPRDPVAPRAAIVAKLTPRLSGPGRTVSQVPVAATDQIREEPLPPLPPLVPSLAPATAGPVAAAPARAVPLAPASPVQPERAPANSPASTRGYAAGFALIIFLITLLLAAAALLFRIVFHWSPEQTRPVSRVREPMLPPVLLSGPDRTGQGAIQQCPQPIASRIRPDLEHPVLRRPTPAATVPGMLQPAGLPSQSENWPAEDQTDIRPHVAALLLREAGWDASIRARPGQPHADVVARRDGRIMVLRCLRDRVLVDEQAVEEACIAREREQADLAVILSSAAFTAEARRLSAQTGIDLLREGELRDFVG